MAWSVMGCSLGGVGGTTSCSRSSGEPSARPGRLELRDRLQVPGSDGHPNQNEHSTADQFGLLSETVAQASADLEAKQREGDADDGDDDRRDHDIHAMGAKGATDYQVVDAQGDADEDKSL